MANNKKYLLTSNHVNYMIFRYLQEAGFTHSAFTFAHESSVIQAPLDPNSVAPGSLIALLQKGLQFLELEANLEGQDGDVDGDFKMLTPEELLLNDIDQLRQLVQERREEERTGGRSQADKRKEKERDHKEKSKAQQQAAGDADGPAPMDEDPSTSVKVEVPASAIINLQHQGEVFTCAWHPTDSLVASGSADGTARIWSVGASTGQCKSVVLPHEGKKDRRDVTTLDWSPDGSQLATGAYDGIARVWTRDGKLKQTLDKHASAVFCIKWNRKGDLLLTGSMDKSVIVWDAKTGTAKQTYQLHSDSALEVDWRNNTTFASCSTDRCIFVCKVGDSNPIRTWKGHAGEVNAIKWDPGSSLLASCSDDGTAKIWSMKSEECLHTLADHTKGVYALCWSHAGSGSSHPNQPLLLATASFDHTVKVWEVDKAKCILTLRGHSSAVYACAFSPDGRFIATGAQDLYVWSIPDGTLVKRCSGGVNIYALGWSTDGSRIAVCFASKVIRVLDLKL